MKHEESADALMYILDEFSERAKASLDPNAIEMAKLIAVQFLEYMDDYFTLASATGLRDPDFETAITCVALIHLMRDNMQSVLAMVKREEQEKVN